MIQPQFAGQQKGKSEVWKTLSSYKSVFFGIGITSFVINLLFLVPSIYMLQVYDRVLTSRSYITLATVTVIMLFMYLVLGLLDWTRSQIMIRLGNAMSKKLDSRAFDVAFKHRLRSGKIPAHKPLQDLITIRQFFTGMGLFAFFDAPWVFIYLVVMYLFHPVLGLFGLFAVIIQSSIAFITELSSRKPLTEANKQSVLANNFAEANLRNCEVIEAMGMLDNVKKHWFPKQLKMLSLQSTASERASIVSSASRFTRLTFSSMGYTVGAYLTIINEITPGLMIAGVILMGRALAPLDLAISSWRPFVAARNAWKRLDSILSMFPVEEKAMTLPPPKGRIQATGLMVVPPGARVPALKGLNFVIEPGEVVGIIGPSASGKSTLARTITGVWGARAGHLRLDGAVITAINRDELGHHIGYLPQDIELLDGTVADNIARFGEKNSEKIITAARMAGIHEMILTLPDGYDTNIGSEGSVLSGGQRQRIALARAVYDMPALVVLDEPNSNLDHVGEAALVRVIDQLSKAGKTVILITHRKPVLQTADKMMVLAGGEMKLFGPREKVLAAMASQGGAQEGKVATPVRTVQ